MEDTENIEEDEYGFSRNYFLAKELGGSSKRSAHKLSDINLVDEQVILDDLLSDYVLFVSAFLDKLMDKHSVFQELRETASNIETKHAKEISELLDGYKTMYPKWVFELR